MPADIEAPDYLRDFDHGAYALRRQVTRVVLNQVQDERSRQDGRWGQQDHPDVPGTTGSSKREAYVYAEHMADMHKEINDFRVKSGLLAWDGILAEEFYEALAETDPAKKRAELLQVAAVAVAWVEAMDRRG